MFASTTCQSLVLLLIVVEFVDLNRYHLHSNMLTDQEKARCLMWFAETKSLTQVCRNFRREYNRQPPSRSNILQWVNKFTNSGSVKKGKSTGRPRVLQERVAQVEVSFEVSPSQSIRVASRELNIPKSTVHKILRKRLGYYPYKLQLVHQLKPNDKPRRLAFATDMLDRIDDEPTFLSRICFSDEATFHTCGKVNKHNCRIWGTQNPHQVLEYERDSPKINVWCGIMRNKVVGPFFFIENNINGVIYQDMLELFAIPQIQGIPGIIFQQDGAPPHWRLDVRQCLDRHFPQRWIGRGGPIQWPPRSPDITPCDFFLWGYIKDIVYRTRVYTVIELRERITAAFLQVSNEMLENTWMELEHRLDVVRANNGGHVEIY